MNTLPLSPCLNYSHKKRKDNLETRAVHIEICMLCWNLVNGPKYRGSFLDNMSCTKGNQLLEGDLHAIMDKIEADILQITKRSFNRKIPATNGSSAPKPVPLQGWSLYFKIDPGRI